MGKKFKPLTDFIMNNWFNLIGYAIVGILIFVLILGTYQNFVNISNGYIPSNVGVVNLLIPTFLLSVFLFWKKHKTILIILLLFAFVLFYIYTYYWQYPNFSYIESRVSGFDCTSSKSLDTYSTLDFYEENNARLYQEITFRSTDNTTTYLGFVMPEGVSWYNLSVSSFNSEVLINETNSTVFAHQRNFYPIIFTRDEYYRFKIDYHIENITPYGNVQFQLQGKDCNKINVESFYTSISFGDISYECLPTCLIPFNQSVVIGTWGMVYNYANFSYKRPTTVVSANLKNTDSLNFRIQAIKKSFVIARNLSLGIIAGLIVAFFRVFIDLKEEEHVKLLNKYKVYLRKMLTFFDK